MVASRWQASFAELIEGLAPCFRTPASLRRAAEYLRGLLRPIPRHNSWQLSEVCGEKAPWALQQFLSKAVWKSSDVRDVLQDYVAVHLGAEDAVFDVDETGFLKKGTHSAGVSSTRGRRDAWRIERRGVFAAYAGRGHALVDGSLYLPKSWCEDEAHRIEARIPEEMAFHTKPEIALEMILQARRRLPFSFVTGDCVYGDDRTLRLRLKEEGIAHVLGVSGKEYVDTSFGHRERVSRVLDEARRAPAEVWHRLPAGPGSKGPRLNDWALRPLVSPRPGWRRWLLVRRSLEGELAAFACAAARADLARTAGRGAGQALGDRELFRRGQAAGRARRVRGAQVRRLAAPHRACDARPRLPRQALRRAKPSAPGQKRGPHHSMEGFLHAGAPELQNSAESDRAIRLNPTTSFRINPTTPIRPKATG